MSKNSTNTAVRTCISCRAKNNKDKLIRLVLDDNGVLIRDLFGKGRGRGAYVCPTMACLEALREGNRLGRAFRKEGIIRLHSDFLNGFEYLKVGPNG